MNFEEHAAKPLLRAVGIETPKGSLATTPDEAERIAAEIGPCVVKAQVPTGKRGKAGGIKLAATPAEARAHAAADPRHDDRRASQWRSFSSKRRCRSRQRCTRR